MGVFGSCHAIGIIHSRSCRLLFFYQLRLQAKLLSPIDPCFSPLGLSTSVSVLFVLPVLDDAVRPNSYFSFHCFFVSSSLERFDLSSVRLLQASAVVCAFNQHHFPKATLSKNLSDFPFGLVLDSQEMLNSSMR